ncbi:MAG: hypothetical protein BWY75_00478 [bacterium ADurb.Bin425]|nr:MAG: hypothetical protein BWY75_00478 [bacterium ADurb.Bin425]
MSSIEITADNKLFAGLALFLGPFQELCIKIHLIGKPVFVGGAIGKVDVGKKKVAKVGYEGAPFVIEAFYPKAFLNRYRFNFGIDTDAAITASFGMGKKALVTLTLSQFWG